MDNTICPACFSQNTRCLPELTNDALDHPEIYVTCDDCGNTGKATYGGPRDVQWDKENDDGE